MIKNMGWGTFLLWGLFDLVIALYAWFGLMETKGLSLEQISHRDGGLLRKDVEEELMDQYGLEIANIDISLKEENNTATIENLQKVTILLKQPETAVESVEAVKPIVINTDIPLPSSTKTTEETEQIAVFLSKKWMAYANARSKATSH